MGKFSHCNDRIGKYSSLSIAINLLLLPLSTVGIVGIKSADAIEKFDTIEVVEKKRGDDSPISSKLRVPKDKLPLKIESLSSTLLEQNLNRGIDDALSLGTSALVSPSTGGAISEIILRGFSDSSFLRNGINNSLGNSAKRSTANVERIEILKGPSSALYGPGEPGGTINFVTKTPETEREHSFNLTVGENSFYEVIVDTTGPVANDETLLYRLIASRAQGEQFRKFLKSTDELFFPALTWLPNESLEVNLSFESMRSENIYDPGIPETRRPGDKVLRQDLFLGEPSIGPLKNSNLTVNLEVTRTLSPESSAKLNMAAQRSKSKGYFVEPNEFIDGSHAELSREFGYLNEEQQSLVVQAQYDRAYELFSRRNYLLLGVEATGLNERIVISGSDAETEAFEIELLSPVFGRSFPAVMLERKSLEKRRQISLYVQNLVDLSDYSHLLVAARYDQINQRGNDRVSGIHFDTRTGRVSPRVGFVIKPRNNISLFASYGGSIDPNEGLQANGEPLAPTRSKSFETGVDWMPTKFLALDLSLYRIKQTGVTTDAPGAPGFEIQTAQQLNYGIDVSTDLTVSDSFELSARYNYVDSEISKDPAIQTGTSALNVPRHQGSLLGTAVFSLLREQDFNAGFAIRYIGARQGSLEPEEIGFKLDSYIRGDLFFQFNLFNKFDFNLHIENFLNEDYIAGSQGDSLSLFPGAPRTIRGSFEVAF